MPGPWVARRRAIPTTTAIVMPVADRRLPLRAVAGEFMKCRPEREAGRADEEGELYQVTEVGRGSWPAPRHSAGLSALGTGRRLEHLQHPVGDPVAADDVRAGENHGDEGEPPLSGLSAVAPSAIAPTRTMPWIEFVPDISGVCSVAGTRS